MSRMFSGTLLAVAFAVLLVPLACYALPPVADSLTKPQLQRAEVVPRHQQAPTELSGGGPVSAPKPSDPLPEAEQLGRLLDAELAVDGSGTFSAVVQDALTGAVLYERDGAAGLALTALDYLCDPELRAAVAQEFKDAGGPVDVPAYFD